MLPNSHGAIEFTYLVGGATYQRTTSAYGLTPPVAEGMAVPVYYYPPKPAIAFTAPGE